MQLEKLADYDFLKRAEIVGRKADSGVGEQPKSLEETVQGAINRAKDSFDGCDYSFGLESGLMSVAQARTGCLNFCACAIYDGKEIYLGLSSAFEFPVEIVELINKEGIDANEATYKSGFSDNPKTNSSEGVIGVLTKGRIKRKDYVKQAIQMALIHLENSEF